MEWLQASHIGLGRSGLGTAPSRVTPRPTSEPSSAPCGPTGETLPFGGAACGTRGNPREGNQAASLNPNFMPMP